MALDVDGTLLTTDGVITDRVRTALAHAEESGWHVVIVTGRPLVVTMPVVEQLGLGEHVVVGNGATVVHLPSGEVLHQASLPGRLVREAIAAAREVLPSLGLAVTTPRGFFREPDFDKVAPLSVMEGAEVLDAMPFADETVHAARLFDHRIDARDVHAAEAPVAPAGVAVTLSGLVGTVELAPPDTHKASGLARLCELLGVARADVVAFGDGLNDHEMLVWAGHGVAMGNAEDATKAIADEVTATNDDDGVAVVMERLLGA